ncbi:MAG TPA: lysylphosphatidylglycerol synthase transmembrane domain-containing protein [Candidatus Sulfotelmatobacter sp.]|nr:lysylphosphatidylglycerol synthase transmembrane domain-containing protein [Candidatus Sulfotelmatobacter sp.]
MTRRRAVQAAVLLVVGVAILVGLIGAVHPKDVAAALGRASPGWVLLGVLGPIGFALLRGWRWKVILDASSPHADLKDVIAITGVGFAINAVGVFKLGDLVRLGAMAQRARIGVGEVGATIVVERVLDVLALLVIAAGAAAAAGGGAQGSRLWGGVIAFAGVSAAIGVAGWVVVSKADWALRQLTRLARRLKPAWAAAAIRLGESVLRGLRSLRSARHLGVALVLSLAIWLVSVAGLVALFRAVSSQLSLSTLLVALALFTISQAVSITPGSVGTYEGFYFLVLTAFGARPQSVVAAAAVLSHIGGIAGLALAGAAGSLWLRLRPASAPVRPQGAAAGEDPA